MKTLIEGELFIPSIYTPKGMYMLGIYHNTPASHRDYRYLHSLKTLPRKRTTVFPCRCVSLLVFV